jgi:hypothetical protein|tara:strand:- start:303 stop:647 length:345 start_codon:yes stop_codon:yes gene_type:complete
MAKAKLTVKSKSESDLGAIMYTTVELLDADGVMKEYGIKDYHDHDGIFDTEIEDMTTGEDIYVDSTLGKRICVALEEYNSDERDSMTYEDAHVNHDIVVPCSAELDNEMYNESI